MLHFPEQTIYDFFIPSFTIDQGEIIVIQLPSGAFFRPLTSRLSSLIIEEASKNQAKNRSFKFVDRFSERGFLNYFFSITIDKYHSKYANKDNSVYKKIYELKNVSSDTKVKKMPGDSQKLLSLYTTISQTNNILFDLIGVSPTGGKKVYDFVKQVAQDGGSVVLFDICDEFKNDCTTFITSKYMGDPAPNFNHSLMNYNFFQIILQCITKK